MRTAHRRLGCSSLFHSRLQWRLLSHHLSPRSMLRTRHRSAIGCRNECRHGCCCMGCSSWPRLAVCIGLLSITRKRCCRIIRVRIRIRIALLAAVWSLHSECWSKRVLPGASLQSIDGGSEETSADMRLLRDPSFSSVAPLGHRKEMS